MPKASEHAISSARRFGGRPEEYIHLHEWFDQTKAYIPDVRHRAILHTSFGINLFEQTFGKIFVNSAGAEIHTRDIGEQHVLGDFKGRFIPTIQDFLGEMDIKAWMSDGSAGYPPSCKKIKEKLTSSGPFSPANDPGARLGKKVVDFLSPSKDL